MAFINFRIIYYMRWTTGLRTRAAGVGVAPPVVTALLHASSSNAAALACVRVCSGILQSLLSPDSGHIMIDKQET